MFLADRANSRTSATMLRPSVVCMSVVCNVCIVVTEKNVRRNK